MIILFFLHLFIDLENEQNKSNILYSTVYHTINLQCDVLKKENSTQNFMTIYHFNEMLDKHLNIFRINEQDKMFVELL